MARVELQFDGSARGALAAARQTREALGGVRSEAKAAGAQFQSTEREVSRLSRGAVAGSGVFRGLGRSIAFASASFLGAAGFVSVVKQAVTGASDLNEQIEKTDEVFRAAAPSIVDWSKTLAASFGIGQREALRYASTLGNILVPMGVAPAKAVEMSKSLVQLAADMGAFNNLPTEDVLTKITSGLAGMPRPLREVGVFLDQDRIKAEAFSDGIVKATVSTQKVTDAQTQVAIAQAKLDKAQRDYGAGTTQVASATLTLRKAQDGLGRALAGSIPDLTRAQKTEAAYNLILNDTTIQQGNFAKTSGDLAQQQKILHAELSNTLDEIGQGLLPIVTKITSAVADWLGKTENQERIQRDVNKAIDTFTGLVKAAWPEVQKLARFVGDGVDAVGGLKNAIELLIGLSVASKVLGMAAAFDALALSEGAAATGALGLLKNLKALRLVELPAAVLAVGSMGETGTKTLKGWSYLGGRWYQTDASAKVSDLPPGASYVDLHGHAGVKAGAAAAASPFVGVATSVAGGRGIQLPTRQTPTHETSNLPGFPAVDIMAKPGTPIGAPEDGIITRISGHEPTEPPPQGQGGPWGLSIYYLGTQTGNTYYMTHLVKVAQPGRYRRGDVIGLIGDYPGSSADHVHFAIHQGDSPEAHYGSSLFNPADYLAKPQGRGGTATKSGGPTAPPSAPALPAGLPPTRGGDLVVGKTPKAPPLPPSIAEQLDRLFGVTVARAGRTAKLSDDLAVIAAELRWINQQLADPKLSAADRLDLEQAKTDLLAKSKDLVAKEHAKQKAEEAALAQATQRQAAISQVGTVAGLAPPGVMGAGDLQFATAALRKRMDAAAKAYDAEVKRYLAKIRQIQQEAAAQTAHALDVSRTITTTTGISPRMRSTEEAVTGPLAARLARMTPAERAAYRDAAKQRMDALFQAIADAARERAQGLNVSGLILAKLKDLPKQAEITIGTDMFGQPIKMSVASAEKEVARLITVIKTGSKQAREAAIAELAQLASGVGQALSDADAAAKQHIDELRTTFENAFQRVSDGVLQGFDRETQTVVDGMQHALDDQLQQLRDDTDARIKQIELAGQALTPAEQALQSLQSSHDAAQAARELADAQKALHDAQTPEERLAAQQRLDDLLYQQQVAALQKQADAERRARDEQTQAQVQALQDGEQAQEKALQGALAAQVQNYEDMRAAQRQWLADQLAAWEQHILDGSASMTDFAKWLQGQGATGVLQGAQIPDPVQAMKDAGDAQGSAFAQGWIDNIQAAYEAWLAFITAVQSGDPNSAPPTGSPGGGGGGGGHAIPMRAGGRVPGVYVGRQDTIMVRATPGEEVIDRDLSLALRRLVVSGGLGGRGGPIVNIANQTFYGTTARQAHQGLARALTPYIGGVSSYRAPL